jgi:uncharacterized small protein (DUF1192 family)
MRNFYYRNFIRGRIRRGYYNDGNNGNPGGDPPTPTPTPTPPNEDDKKFSQKDLNAIIKKEKDNWQKTQRQQVAQLEDFKKTAGLSQERVTELEKQIADLESQYMSKEEIARRDAEKAKKDYDTKLETTSSEAKKWQNTFTNLLVETRITAAANEAGAYNNQQMLDLLGGKAKVVPVTQDGKETGQYDVRILLPARDKEGKPVVLDLTPTEAMKQMKEMPENFGNLFKGQGTGGLGGNNNGTPTGSRDLKTLAANAEEYRKNRKTLVK